MFVIKALAALCLSNLVGAVAIPEHQLETRQNQDILDALIIGGGPSGLSAASGLARVRRTALLVDSGEYRNSKGRHMHDVIGLDGKYSGGRE